MRARALAVAVGVVACMLNACEQPLLWSQCRIGGYRACRVGEASHPGPSSVDSSSSSLSDLSFWCINTGGPKYAWTVLSDAACASVDVVALQELRMLPRELSAFSAKARQIGFALYAQPGPTGVGRWKEDRAWAGAALLVSTKLRSRACALVGGDGGQAVLAWVNGAVLGSCYVAQSDEAADFQAELLQNVAALSPSTRWMLMGDWNMTPSQNGVLASLQRCEARLAAVTDANMQVLPTRWDGKRAIDYIVAHETCVISGLAFGEVHYNDHKLLLGRLRVAKMVGHVDWQLCPAAHYFPPEGFPADRWSELLYEGWSRAAPLPEVHGLTADACDAWWMAAMAKLEEAFKYAWYASRDPEAKGERIPLPIRGVLSLRNLCFELKCL